MIFSIYSKSSWCVWSRIRVVGMGFVPGVRRIVLRVRRIVGLVSRSVVIGSAMRRRGAAIVRGIVGRVRFAGILIVILRGRIARVARAIVGGVLRLVGMVFVRWGRIVWGVLRTAALA